MMKRNFHFFAVLLSAIVAVVSCSKGEIRPVDGPADAVTSFNAYSEASLGRTALNLENYGILWNEGDAITVFGQGSGKADFQCTSVSDNGARATFSGFIPSSQGYTAVYPASSSPTLDDDILCATVPSVQRAVDNGFDPAAAVAVAQSGGNDLFFRNVGSLLGVVIRNDGIASVTISALDFLGVSLTGEFIMDVTDPESQALSYRGVDSVMIAGTLTNDNVYYAAVLPGTFTDLKIVFRDVKGRTATFRNPNALSVARGRIIDVIDITVAESDWKGGSSDTGGQWRLVNSTSDLVAGDLYLMVCRNSGKSSPESVVASDYYSTYLKAVSADEVMSDDKTLLEDTPEGAMVFTLGGFADNWTLSDPDGRKLGASKVKNLCWGTGTTTWKISLSAGNASIRSTNSSYGAITYNQSSPRFLNYDNYGKEISLYHRQNVSSVTTVETASDITQNSALLQGSYRCISGTPAEIGFQYGTSEESLTGEAFGVPTGSSGDISVTLQGLRTGTTYYYRAFITEGTTTLTGRTASFTTLGGDTPPVTGGADYPWPELPAQTDKDRNGIDDNNPDFYYSHTFRADASSIRNFSSCYSKGMAHPVWVAAPMHKCYLGSSGRNDSYKPDPNIGCTQSAKFSGYTRGHMVGSADRTVSVATNRQAFYYSNIGAQLSSGFNTGGGAWNNLEDCVDSYLCADTLYQVIGCIFETFTDRYGTTVSKKSGSNGAGASFQVPTAWYKVLLRTKKGNSGRKVSQCSASELQCVAFILSHKGNQSHKPTVGDMYTVSEVERLTGLTFFVNVPNAPKDNFTAADWNF